VRVAELGGVVEPRPGAQREQARQLLALEARGETERLARATERREPGAVPGREQLVVPFELHQRVAPVEENRVEHRG
jgi:hypothetical protein